MNSPASEKSVLNAESAIWIAVAAPFLIAHANPKDSWWSNE
jgi:hypothetical protein